MLLDADVYLAAQRALIIIALYAGCGVLTRSQLGSDGPTVCHPGGGATVDVGADTCDRLNPRFGKAGGRWAWGRGLHATAGQGQPDPSSPTATGPTLVALVAIWLPQNAAPGPRGRR